MKDVYRRINTRTVLFQNNSFFGFAFALAYEDLYNVYVIFLTDLWLICRAII